MEQARSGNVPGPTAEWSAPDIPTPALLELSCDMEQARSGNVPGPTAEWSAPDNPTPALLELWGTPLGGRDKPQRGPRAH
ncbi:hypothetical protein TNCV_2408171 [Trichonephila clavipes]|nr:hypothetical protein TNCV_2408171 [Trichonephila clavipes]